MNRTKLLNGHATALIMACGLFTGFCTTSLAHNVSGRIVCQETGEPLPNICVRATGQNPDNTFDTTTDSEGNFFIDLAEVTETYTLTICTPGAVVTSPPGGSYVFTSHTECSPPALPCEFPGKDFQIHCEAPPACIGDFVWYDLNGNGIQDNGEPGAPGVTVALYDCLGNVLATQPTGPNGEYLFCELTPGDYFVGFTLPPGYSFSPENQGADDAKDSDANPVTGLATCTTLSPGETDRTWDAGLILQNSSCPLVVTKGCIIPPPAPPTSFDCSGLKPIDSITMTWAGSGTIGIKAWKGAANSSTLLATINNIIPGQTITVSGYAGSPNDVYWELFDGTTGGAKLGQSTFHLSCSDVDMNGPEDCGKLEGDGKGKIGFINQWIFQGMAGNGKSIGCSSATATPSSSCTVLEAPFADCTTAGKPTSLTFRYTGGGCPASNNPQSGKFLCSGSIDPSLAVNVSSANGYAFSKTSVQPGETFTVSAGSFAAQSGFTLQNSGGTESLSIHTSCSQPLRVGDVFGSLTLVAFNGQTGGSSIIYHYTVMNNGPTPLAGIILTDDQLGNIAGPFSLAAGETKAFDVPVALGDTSVNIATAFIPGQDCQASTGPVTVTVLHNCPVPQPVSTSFDCAGMKPIDSISMIWNGSQTIGVKAWKGPANSSTLLGTFNNVAPGQTLTVNGYAGSPNDVYWELFDGTTAGAKLGESTFHLSCSDVDMNGPEDCGKAEGDGKARTGFINQWIFAGMSGNGKTINCSSPQDPPTVFFSGKQLKWALANQGTSKLTMTGMTLSWPASNKKLLKVKFDGDVAWDKKSAPGATSIVLTESDLVADPNKRSINPGQTRVFTLEFEADASTSLGDYALTVSFGDHCVLSAP